MVLFGGIFSFFFGGDENCLVHKKKKVFICSFEGMKACLFLCSEGVEPENYPPRKYPIDFSIKYYVFITSSTNISK